MSNPLPISSPAWRRPEVLLLLMAAAVPLSFSTWMAMLDNFSIHRAGFTGREIGILQSLREVPGFLAFAVVFLLLLIREQRLAVLSLALLGAGTAVTGLFPSAIGLYITTVVMSLGYHYYETLQSSLAMQWIDKQRAPETFGRIIAVGSFTSVLSFGLVWLAFERLSMDFAWVYAIGGGATAAIALVAWLAFPHFPEKVTQHKHMVLRRRYWLYYALTFMSGARRQIFIVFAGFLMVEKFGFDVSTMALLFLANAVANIWLAPKIGRLIGRIGERKALIFEYAGLIGVFSAYAFVDDATLAAGLYLADHMFFALAIAIKTYFQKIADPADIASTAGVSFTINHIAAVILPVAFGVLWLVSPAAVFLSGAAMAGISLVLATNVPLRPQPGNEVVVGRVPALAARAEAVNELRHPPPLRDGARVSIVAPSGPIPRDAFERGIECIRGMGLEPVFDGGLLCREGFLAGSDERRIAELLCAVEDPDTALVWAARGGYGATRLLPKLDVEAIGRASKHLVGFSDITALHATWHRAGLSSTHAANVTTLAAWSAPAVESLRAALHGEGWPDLEGEGGCGNEAAAGMLLGGNLTVLAAMAGTPYFPPLDDAILLVEDVNEAPYRLDRVLTQLTQTGALQRLAGVAIGHLTRCDDRTETPHGCTALDVIRAHVDGLCLPAVWGLPVGHEPGSWAVPLGRRAVLDPRRRSLSFPA